MLAVAFLSSLFATVFSVCFTLYLSSFSVIKISQSPFLITNVLITLVFSYLPFHSFLPIIVENLQVSLRNCYTLQLLTCFQVEIESFIGNSTFYLTFIRNTNILFLSKHPIHVYSEFTQGEPKLFTLPAKLIYLMKTLSRVL